MRLIVFSNIFVALCAAGMLLASYLSLGIPPNKALLSLVFFATLAVYNLDRLLGASTEDRHDTSPRHQWIRSYNKFSELDK